MDAILPPLARHAATPAGLTLRLLGVRCRPAHFAAPDRAKRLGFHPHRLPLVGLREHAAVRARPFDIAHAVQRAASRVPAGRAGMAEAIRRVLRVDQCQVGAGDLGVAQHRVDIEEKGGIDVHDLQRHRHGLRRGRHAHARDIAAPEHAHRRAGAGFVGDAPGAALAREELLHLGQEGDELVAVALVKAAAVTVVFVDPAVAAVARRRA